MKVEFNGSNFSANMNNDEDFNASGVFYKRFPLKLSRTFILGIIALAISVFVLPLGFFMNFCADVLSKTLDVNLSHWIVLIAVCSFSFLAVSVTCGILGIIFYSKSEKEKDETVGFILSIASFATTVLCLVINILSL